jgi:hypothetical protein
VSDGNEANRRYHARIQQEYAELDDPMIKGQMALDRWMEARRDANRPAAISDYSPVARLEEELDYRQEEADRAWARRLGYGRVR